MIRVPDNTRVLVTRPSDQAAGLMRALQSVGADVLHRPTLSIVPLSGLNQTSTKAPDWCVFTSPNAVRYGLAQWPTQWSGAIRLAAVGPGTAAALAAAGRTVTVAPAHGGGADDLLAQADFLPRPGEQVLIIRGEGGRQRLQQALRARAVEVVEWAVYRRQRPAGELDIPVDWLHSRLSFTIVTSASGLENLLGMADSAALEWLLQSQLITVSERIAQQARAAGFNQPVIAAGADDQALTDAVVANRQE